jgi:predicted CopG family antitoxin
MLKIIKIKEEIWKELYKLKIDLDKKTISETIKFLIEFYKSKGEKT